MKISELMHKNVEVIEETSTVMDAARKMAELDVGVLPVRGGNDKVVGMVTDRDIVVRALAKGENPESMAVTKVMTNKVEWCFDDETVETASKKMSEKQIQRLLVMNRDKRLVGIVSLADLSRAQDQHVKSTVQAIKSPTKPTAAGASQNGAR
jgi:CBS domain-containing protein